MQTAENALPDSPSTPSSSGPAVPPERRDEFIAKIKEANAGWRSGVAKMQRHEMEFALRLARCSNPVEAVGVCSEWMASRIDSAVAMQNRFLDLWLSSISSARQQTAAGSEPTEAGSDQSEHK